MLTVSQFRDYSLWIIDDITTVRQMLSHFEWSLKWGPQSGLLYPLIRPLDPLRPTISRDSLAVSLNVFSVATEHGEATNQSNNCTFKCKYGALTWYCETFCTFKHQSWLQQESRRKGESRNCWWCSEGHTVQFHQPWWILILGSKKIQKLKNWLIYGNLLQLSLKLGCRTFANDL